MRQGFRMLTLLALTLGADTVLADSSRSIMKQVEVRGHGERADVVLEGNFRAQSYAVRTRAGGDVIIIEVADAALEDHDGVTLESTDLVRAATASATEHGVRIELTLQKHVTYRARSVDNGLVIALEQLEAGGRADELPSDGARPLVQDSPSQAAAPQAGALSLRGVRLEKRDERERVVLELSRPSEFRILPGSVGAARMEIKR
ncbi:MAG: Type pilus biosis protein PilQ, partial [Myxococcaceae bacterium]|nr:Type pilus biosis protein PilQ [Myxococcaceae bacterium]